MEIWLFNDPEPLHPFLQVLEQQAPNLASRAHRLFSQKSGPMEPADLVFLARGLLDESRSVRRAVRVLIFAPPVEDELGHFRRLLRWLPRWLPPGWHQDPSLLEDLVELLCLSPSRQGCLPLATAVEAVVKRSLPGWGQKAARLWLTPEPANRRFLLSRLQRRLPWTLNPGLGRRLLAAGGLSFGQICEAIAIAGRCPAAGALRRWQQVLAAGISHEAPCSWPPPCPARLAGQQHPGRLRILFWDQRPSAQINYLERLISYQANELVAVSRLARQVSRRTRRVVLTLDNASLGAACGWGIPSFPQQIPVESQAAFSDQVRRSCSGLARVLASAGPGSAPGRQTPLNEEVAQLFHLWSRRLVKPRILQDLGAWRLNLLVNDLPLRQWDSFLDQARDLLDPDDRVWLAQGGTQAIAFVPGELLGQRLRWILSWYWEKKTGHLRFLALLGSLAKVAGDWLAAGHLSSFILPVIDKFFISSQRDRDLHYLPLFVRLLRRLGQNPLFLLIDDTSRAAYPSLQLAMQRWRQQQHPFAGLGIFAGHKDTGGPPLQSILARAARICLFALRPLSQVHNPIPLETLLSRRPADFLTPEGYDSAWKDNLPFLYHGTQVSPLTGPMEQAEEFSPAVVTAAGPVPFGTYYRGRLRWLALERLGLPGGGGGTGGGASADLERLWQEYARLANLL